MSLAWVYQLTGVTSTIIGATSMEQLKEEWGEEAFEDAVDDITVPPMKQEKAPASTYNPLEPQPKQQAIPYASAAARKKEAAEAVLLREREEAEAAKRIAMEEEQAAAKEAGAEGVLSDVDGKYFFPQREQLFSLKDTAANFLLTCRSSG